MYTYFMLLFNIKALNSPIVLKLFCRLNFDTSNISDFFIVSSLYDFIFSDLTYPTFLPLFTLYHFVLFLSVCVSNIYTSVPISRFVAFLLSFACLYNLESELMVIALVAVFICFDIIDLFMHIVVMTVIAIMPSIMANSIIIFFMLICFSMYSSIY